MSQIFKSIEKPIRSGLSNSENWNGEDKGLILCWELGRKNAMKDLENSLRARNGELIPLGWKGGVDKPNLKGKKIGSFNYYAQWLGLRGEDLDIDTSVEKTLICSSTGMIVTFTADIDKLKDA